MVTTLCGVWPTIMPLRCCCPKRSPSSPLSLDSEWKADTGKLECCWYRPLPLAYVCCSRLSCIMGPFTSCLLQDESTVLLQCKGSEPDELAVCKGVESPDSIFFLELCWVPLLSTFFVLRKRPPLPLALLIAC